MNEQPHIDYEGLAAFIAGELDEVERGKWEAWIADSRENAKLYRECVMLFEPSGRTDTAAKFDSKAAWQKVDKAIEPKVVAMPVEESNSRTGWWQWAAVVAIGAMLITYMMSTWNSDLQEYAQESGVATYILPDSSLVTLKGKASIAFADDFNRNHRAVALQGQGYFDVQHNDSLAFEVSTERGLLTVLGTAFLMEETKDSLYVVVERGHVSVGLKKESERLDLTKNETGIIEFSTSTLREKSVSSLNSLYWANRKLSYRQRPLDEVLQEIGDIFDKEMVYDASTLVNCRITAIFRDQSFEEIMENIELSFPVRYQIDGNRVEIESNGCSTP